MHNYLMLPLIIALYSKKSREPGYEANESAQGQANLACCLELEKTVVLKLHALTSVKNCYSW